MGSSKSLKEDYKIYGIENFTKIILSYERFIDKYALCKKESYYIHKYNTLSPIGYNRYDPGKKLGFSMSGLHFSEEHKQKISKSNKGRKISEWHKQRVSQTHKGKSLSKEHKEKISKANKGKIPWNKGLSTEEIKTHFKKERKNRHCH